MRWEDYAEGIREFCIYPGAFSGNTDELNYLVLGLLSEAGEVAGIRKKEIRDSQIGDYKAEIGDCLWYITRLLDTMNITIEECMEANYNKLKSRKERNVLSGKGDYR